jgi:hypothetical protein
MVFTHDCAHGDAASVTLQCADVVALAPLDDSVDTNFVHIEGMGTITSFGEGPRITKRVLFLPTDGATITLVNSPALVLLAGKQRIIRGTAHGEYICDGEGRWIESYFAETGVLAVEHRIDELERRMAELEKSPRLQSGQHKRSRETV